MSLPPAVLSALPSLIPPSQILTPSSGEPYTASLTRWASNAERPASLVLLPSSASEVSKAVRFATEHGIPLAIKGGGHSTSGASSADAGGVVIDLSAHLNEVKVDVEKKLLYVGGGALWADVDRAAWEHGLATVGGTVSHTGVGGLTVGGGYGWLTPKYGLTIDCLQSAEVVLASGEILTCSETSNPDLFWAIRGGGSNFGIVTLFTYHAFPQPNPIWAGLLIYPPPFLPALFSAAQAWATASGEDESGMIVMACPPPAFNPMLAVIPFFNGSPEEGKEKFKPFYDVGPVADLTRSMPYPELNEVQNPMATHGDRKLFRTTAFVSLSPKLYQAIFDAYAALVSELPEAAGSAVIIELHDYKKVVAVPPEATAFANRGRWYNLNFAMRWKSPQLDERMRAWSKEQVEVIRAFEKAENNLDLEGAHGYSNLGMGDERVKDVFGVNYERLTRLKKVYDPGMVFNKWFAIPPAKD